MGALGTKTYRVVDISSQTLPTTQETVVATLRGVAAGGAGRTRVALMGWIRVDPGAGTTRVFVRLRRGTAVTDPLVGRESAHTVGGGQSAPVDVDAVDTPPDGVYTYVLTAQQEGATANGLVATAAITAWVH